jgi:L-ascorbate metabolism protein UlaG (beta-lactamase superfamily)
MYYFIFKYGEYKMKKVISILLLLFFLVAIVPVAGYCEDNNKDKAAAGAAAAGTAAGTETFIGMHAGTIAIGALIIAGIAVIAFGSGGGSSTTNH